MISIKDYLVKQQKYFDYIKIPFIIIISLLTVGSVVSFLTFTVKYTDELNDLTKIYNLVQNIDPPLPGLTKEQEAVASVAVDQGKTEISYYAAVICLLTTISFFTIYNSISLNMLKK